MHSFTIETIAKRQSCNLDFTLSVYLSSGRFDASVLSYLFIIRFPAHTKLKTKWALIKKANSLDATNVLISLTLAKG